MFSRWGRPPRPYQIYDAFFDVTKAASGWDTETVKRSLNVLSETIDQTYPHLSAALDGVARFSDTIGKRDEEVRSLLGNANKIASVLGNRSEQINALLVNAQTLLGAVNERSYAVSMLLERVGEFSTQVAGFVNDNPNLNKVLEQLRTISDILKDRKFDLVDVLSTLSKFTASLAEAIASGPFFKVMLVNLLPPWLLQPFVDSAFKKRGIDPEEFWRNAGLPAWRFPDPNGTRFPNGAPAPGPDVLEGTPANPGPAVVAGHPCSYTPTAEGLPRPGDPLPCQHLSTGPFGSNPYSAPPGQDYNTLPGVITSPPNPNGPGFTPACPPRPSPASCRPIWVVCPHRFRPLRRARAPCRSARCLPRGRTSLLASHRCRLRSTVRRRRLDRAPRLLRQEPRCCRAIRRSFHLVRRTGRAQTCQLSSMCET